jgi:hypothetical protein
MSQVNITLNTNTVDINTTNNQIVVTDPTNPTTVNITQPVTTVVEVITAGPQGTQGPQGLPGPSGSSVNTGSFVTTSSFNAFTSSYNTGSFTGSFTGSLLGTASFVISASYAETASFAPAYLPLSGGIINGNVTVNGTASIAFLNVTIESASVIYSSGSNQFGDATSDIQTLIGTVIVSGSQQITGSLNVTQGITGSFSGSGANLNSIPTSAIIGNFTQIATGSVTASVTPTQFTVVSGSVTEFTVTGTGVTIGNAITDTHIITGSAQITGSLGITGSIGIRYNTPSSNGITITGHYPALRLVNSGSAALANGGLITVQDNNFATKDQGQGVMALTVVDSISTNKGNITWTKDSINATNTAFNYNSFNDTAIYISGSGNVGIKTTTPNSASLHVSGNVFASSYTGSLFGTASFAVSSSRAVTSSFAISASWAPSIAGGSNTQVQFNSGSRLLGTGSFTFNYLSQSLQQGLNVTASGLYSHAEGEQTIAFSDYSHAEGRFTTASGDYSHAEGINTKTLGVYSHAEGSNTVAKEAYSHAEGYLTTSSANYSHAEGYATITSGLYSHTEGRSTITLGESSHAEGISTVTGINTAFTIKTDAIKNGQITLSGDETSKFTPGGYLYVYNVPDDTKTTYLIDTVNYEGSDTLIQLVDTSVNINHASFGDVTYLKNNGTFGGTNNNTIPGNYSHAEGGGTQAIGDYSHTEGASTIALGSYSHAEGVSTISQGIYSHAEGRSTTAQGENSHAEGRGTIAVLDGAHAEGYETIASGSYSHAEGSGTQAIGDYSHAEGLETLTQGNYSHTEGYGTIALGQYQHVQGQYNISSEVQSAFIHGNGTDGGNRSNLIYAHDSIVEITGSLDVTGGITGNLTGTATNATNADNATNATSASFVTGSNVFGPFGSNSILSASFAISSSRAVSSSFAISSSFAVSSSRAESSSFAINAATASYILPLSQNVIISGSLKLDPTQDPDPTGTDLDSTVLFQSSSNTALGYDLYIRQNGNLVKWKWIEGILETGLLYGGVVTYSGSNVFISPGSGIIAEHNATTSSEVSPMIQYVTWNAITQSVTNIATQQVTYLYIDNTGALQQQSTRFTSQQYHSYIPLGAVGHFDYTQVSAFGGSVQTAYDQGSQTSNFIDAFGPLKMSGYGLTGQAASLRLSVGSGISFIHGGFYQNDPEFPSQITTPSQATASIAYVYRSGSGVRFDTNGGNLYTSLRPGFYDDGTGTTGSLSNNNWTIQRIYSDPKTGVLYVYYGQTIYATYLNAVGAVATDEFTEGDTFDFTTFIGFAIVKSNTSNITDTDNKLVPAGLFRGSGQGSGGGIAVSNLDDLTDVSILSPTNGEALIYDAGLWKNGTPISASFSSTASFAQGGNGSFSGSFSGSGANLFGIPASGITGLNLSQIATGSVTASVSPSQFSVISGSVTEFLVTGTGVTIGSISTDIHTVTGSLNISGSVTAVDYTGSLFGTASWAENAVSSSFALTASFALNAGGGGTSLGTLQAFTLGLQNIF